MPRGNGCQGRFCSVQVLTDTKNHYSNARHGPAVNLKSGKDASGHVSLRRSAIMAANAKPSSDTIIVPSGTFLLTIPVPAVSPPTPAASTSTAISRSKVEDDQDDHRRQSFGPRHPDPLGKVSISGVTIQSALAEQE